MKMRNVEEPEGSTKPGDVTRRMAFTIPQMISDKLAIYEVT